MGLGTASVCLPFCSTVLSYVRTVYHTVAWPSDRQTVSLFIRSLLDHDDLPIPLIISTAVHELW
jgi:hypothetical protein